MRLPFGDVQVSPDVRQCVLAHSGALFLQASGGEAPWRGRRRHRSREVTRTAASTSPLSIWLLETPVKAQDELAALALDGGPQQPKEAMRRSKQPCEVATSSDRAFNRVWARNTL